MSESTSVPPQTSLDDAVQNCRTAFDNALVAELSMGAHAVAALPREVQSAGRPKADECLPQNKYPTPTPLH